MGKAKVIGAGGGKFEIKNSREMLSEAKEIIEAKSFVEITPEKVPANGGVCARNSNDGASVAQLTDEIAMICHIDSSLKTCYLTLAKRIGGKYTLTQKMQFAEDSQYMVRIFRLNDKQFLKIRNYNNPCEITLCTLDDNDNIVQSNTVNISSGGTDTNWYPMLFLRRKGGNLYRLLVCTGYGSDYSKDGAGYGIFIDLTITDINTISANSVSAIYLTGSFSYGQYEDAQNIWRRGRTGTYLYYKIDWDNATISSGASSTIEDANPTKALNSERTLWANKIGVFALAGNGAPVLKTRFEKPVPVSQYEVISDGNDKFYLIESKLGLNRGETQEINVAVYGYGKIISKATIIDSKGGSYSDMTYFSSFPFLNLFEWYMYDGYDTPRINTFSIKHTFKKANSMISGVTAQKCNTGDIVSLSVL